MPIWTVDRNRVGSSDSSSATRARATLVCALLEASAPSGNDRELRHREDPFTTMRAKTSASCAATMNYCFLKCTACILARGPEALGAGAIGRCERECAPLAAGVGAKTKLVRETGKISSCSTPNFPRGTDLSAYSQSDLDKIALRLNQRPRETLPLRPPPNWGMSIGLYVAAARAGTSSPRRRRCSKRERSRGAPFIAQHDRRSD